MDIATKRYLVVKNIFWPTQINIVILSGRLDNSLSLYFKSNKCRTLYKGRILFCDIFKFSTHLPIDAIFT